MSWLGCAIFICFVDFLQKKLILEWISFALYVYAMGMDPLMSNFFMTWPNFVSISFLVDKICGNYLMFVRRERDTNFNMIYHILHWGSFNILHIPPSLQPSRHYDKEVVICRQTLWEVSAIYSCHKCFFFFVLACGF